MKNNMPTNSKSNDEKFPKSMHEASKKLLRKRALSINVPFPNQNELRDHTHHQKHVTPPPYHKNHHSTTNLYFRLKSYNLHITVYFGARTL